MCFSPLESFYILWLIIRPLGRAWTVEELRRKGWNDLHSLWWTCLKERNRILTEEYTRKELNAGYGEFEATERIRVVSITILISKGCVKSSIGRGNDGEYQVRLARTVACL